MIKTLLKPKIEDSSMLATFLNIYLRKLYKSIIVNKPKTFTEFRERKEWCKDDKETYGDLCQQILLFAEYSHKVVKHLRHIISVIDEYQTEYESNWKYYATAKRLKRLKKELKLGRFLSDDYEGDILHDDGRVKMGNVPDDVLEDYSIIYEICCNNSRTDIINDTMPNDIPKMRILAKYRRKIFDKEIEKNNTKVVYVKEQVFENGKYRDKTIDEQCLEHASYEADVAEVEAMLKLCCFSVKYLLYKAKQLNKQKDNKNELEEIKQMAKSILYCASIKNVDMDDFKAFCHTISSTKQNSMNK